MSNINNNVEKELKEMSIDQLLNSKKEHKYIVPIYQRNFAWGKDEIETLIRDIYDCFRLIEKDTQDDNKPNYYIGTLVTYMRRDGKYEVIDGQQRLTAIYLILTAFGEKCNGLLEYTCREKTTNTLNEIDKIQNNNTEQDVNDKLDDNKKWIDNQSEQSKSHDSAIIKGFKNTIVSICSLVPKDEREKFLTYFKKHIMIIRYQVPKDTDLNHYFEIMNTRGEQLEQHEIVKARLMSILKEEERHLFSDLWDKCLIMDSYTQRKMKEAFKEDITKIYDKNYGSFICNDAQSLFSILGALHKQDETVRQNKRVSINSFCSTGNEDNNPDKDKDSTESFQQIIDFPNFLLIVLKITLQITGRNIGISLNKKRLLASFDVVLHYLKDNEKPEFVKDFIYYLLKAKFFLDNYIVHQSKKDNKKKGEPEPESTWELKIWSKKPGNDPSSPQQEKDTKPTPRNLSNEDDIQAELVQLLSMFEVTYSSHENKDYLFYCLYYLIATNNKESDKKNEYKDFLAELAHRYFHTVYLKPDSDGNSEPENESFSSIFDKAIISWLEKKTSNDPVSEVETLKTFKTIYGDGENKSRKEIPLFIFNYLDYKIWAEYHDTLKRQKANERDPKRVDFFPRLGCSDIGLDFKNFYFSSTRDTLEHYFPAANVKSEENPNTDENVPDEIQANCFGNFARIGGDINSSGSNNEPIRKLKFYYKDHPKCKDPKVSVASLKFQIMMQICKNEGTWGWDQIREHQGKMLDILFDIPEKQDDSKKS